MTISTWWLARVSVPHKLSGPEIKNIRKTIGLRANELAVFLDMTPEHYSRIENGAPFTTNAERIFRLRAAHILRDKAKGVRIKDDDILNMNFTPVRTSPDPITLVFDRVRILDDSLNEVWHFIGVDGSKQTKPALKVVA